MNILVTGAKGFLGKHICLALKRKQYNVFEYDLSSSEDELLQYIKEANYVIHLAGINRPLNNDEFYNGNTNFTKKLVDLLLTYNKNAPIIFSSSIQASLDNDYGKSKRMAEEYILSSCLTSYVFRLNNVFGKWCRPNYNSAAATFMYNIAHNEIISIRDRDYVVHYNYIDDIVVTFIDCINGKIKPSKDILYVSPTYDCSLGRLADLLYSFKEAVESDKHLPLIHNEFELKLFISFLDYLNDDKYPLNYAEDDRGYFAELYKNDKYGQISINMSYPFIIKGGHYHTYKSEIFETVIGHCLIEQENINNHDKIVDDVSEDNPKLVNIIPFYSHSIKNVGTKNSYTLMWISQIYNPDSADTFKH